MNAQTKSVIVIPQVSSVPMIIAADTVDILGALKAEIDGYEPDASTDAGRKEIGSKARKVGAAKQDLLRLAATLKDDAQKKVKAINAEEALIKGNCDAIRDAILAPLDAYKQIERDRVAGHESALQELHGAAYVQPGSSTETIKATLNAFQNRPSREWQEYIWRAREVVQSGIRHIQECLAFSEKQEAEAAELARLREAEAKRQAEEAARAQAEREARIAAEAAERAKVEAEHAAARAAAEAQRKASEAAEQARQQIEAEKRRAEQAEAARLAEIERARRQHEADLAAAAERERQTEAARIAAAEQAERDQAAAVDAERRRVADEAAAKAKADAERAANVAHKSKVMGAAKAAIMAIGLSEDAARDLVKAIVAGSIPHVRMEF